MEVRGQRWIAAKLVAASLAASTSGCPSQTVQRGASEGLGGESGTAGASETGESSGEPIAFDRKLNIAIDEDFEDWDGQDFELPRREMPSPYPDNNTVVSIAGHRCLMVHAQLHDNEPYYEEGAALELELPLSEYQTDMTGEDYFISFDFFVPHDNASEDWTMQFAFYELVDYTPIYSLWYSGLTKGQWTTIEAAVDARAGDIGFSLFFENPEDWRFDTVRIQFYVFDGNVGDEAMFCIDNLLVAQMEEH